MWKRTRNFNAVLPSSTQMSLLYTVLTNRHTQIQERINEIVLSDHFDQKTSKC